MPHRHATRRFLATVLFTDIVGSTERAAGLGDRAWRDLLERHHALVRRELKAYGGREISTSGDGFYAVFDAPEAAVRSAEAITTAVESLGLRVRAGVHTGECEVIDGEVGGMAVNIGARVGALAGPGEVLVSGSVRDLMTGSDLRFEGGEPRTLKGVADPWRVYRLVPADVTGDVVADRRPLLPLYTRRQRRRLVAVIAGLLAGALALPTAGYLLLRSDAEVVVGEDAVGVIGPDGATRATIGVGQRPTGVDSGFGSVWVTNSGTESVSRIDPEQNVSSPINLEHGSSPSGVAVGAGAVWVANSGNATVARIDPVTSRVTTNIKVRPGPSGVVVAFGSVWVTNALDASVTEIDPDTNKVRKEITVGAGPTGIAAGAGYLWVTNQGDGTVTRFHPGTYVADSAINVGNGPTGIAVAGGAAWVANNVDGSLWRIDVDDLGVTSRTLVKDGGAYGVAARDGTVWVSNEHAGTLMRVTTAEDFRLADTVPVGGAPLGLAFVGDDLWFTSAAGSALHRGGVLTMVATAGLQQVDDSPDTDLTLHYSGSSFQLAQLINDGLVGFRRAGGVRGAGVVPDLATSLPDPTNGGLTYTFHLRKGVRYSTGAPVLAGDIRRGIERSVLYRDTPRYLRSAIVGAKACGEAADRAVAAHEPRPPCDLSSGMVANDRTGTITFHLTRPTPEFVYQLALPNASAIPQDTPDDLPPGTSLPATGPYMIRALAPERAAQGGLPARRGRLELVRNPQFRVWSPAAQPAGYPDRIVLKTGYTAKQAVALVADGRADLLFGPVPSANIERLGTRYSSQLHTTPGIYNLHLYLNRATPPFNNVDARRAVAFALDRGALAASFDGSLSVTCQLIPPGFAAYRRYCPFTLSGGAPGEWRAPDVNRANALVRRSGTRGAKVVVLQWDAQPRSRVKPAVEVLRDLGYRVSVRRLRVFPPEYATTHRHSWNLGITDWGADYPAASRYLAAIGACDPNVGGLNLSRYCDKEVDNQIKAALGQQVTDPGSANEAWSRIDREIVDAAAVIPFGIDLRQDFVSRRVGNILVHPISGPLIAQMWVQ